MSAPDTTRFYFVGLRPIRFVPTPEGGMLVLKMNWETGAFEYGMEYLDRAMSGRGEVQRVSEREFMQKVEAWRARNLSGDGPVFALYALINAMEDQAREEGRPLRDDEKALVEELRAQSYRAFEERHRVTPPGAS